MTEKEGQINWELDNILQELSWLQLKEFIFNFRKSLLKKVTAGGVRVQPQNRKMVQSVVKRECLENQNIRYALFSVWFNSHKEYHDCLSPFFKSEEHEELLKERGIDEGYVINSALFQTVADIIRPNDINKFFLLSPIVFTEFQKEELEKIRNRQQQDRSTVQVPVETEDKSRKPTDKGLFLSKGEWKGHQKELKKYQQETARLDKENEKLRKKVKDSAMVRAECRNQLDEKDSAHAGEIEELQREIRELRGRIKTLDQGAESTAKQLEEKDRRISNLERALKRMQSENDTFFQRIVGEIDSEDLLAGLNTQADVLELLRTVIRPPTSDSHDGDRQFITFREFWQVLAAREKELMENVVLALTVEESANDCFFSDWGDRVDDFSDLKCSLLARYYLVDMFYEILRQYFEKQEGRKT